MKPIKINSIDEFKQYAALAKSIGATQIKIEGDYALDMLNTRFKRVTTIHFKDIASKTICSVLVPKHIFVTVWENICQSGKRDTLNIWGVNTLSPFQTIEVLNTLIRGHRIQFIMSED